MKTAHRKVGHFHKWRSKDSYEKNAVHDLLWCFNNIDSSKFASPITITYIDSIPIRRSRYEENLARSRCMFSYVQFCFFREYWFGEIPKGKWLDKNWNAIWEFGADNIRLLDTNGSEILNFKDKISNFKIDIGVSEAKVSFTSTEAERKYVFTKGVTDLDLVMDIDPDWTDEDYRVKMELQK